MNEKFFEPKFWKLVIAKIKNLFWSIIIFIELIRYYILLDFLFFANYHIIQIINNCI